MPLCSGIKYLENIERTRYIGIIYTAQLDIVEHSDFGIEQLDILFFGQSFHGSEIYQFTLTYIVQT